MPFAPRKGDAGGKVGLGAPAPMRPDAAMPELRLEPAFPALAFDRPLFFTAVPGTDRAAAMK